MGGFFRNFCCNDNDEILWFIILFLLLFWNGCGCNNDCGCTNNSNNDCNCGCNSHGTTNLGTGCGC